MIFQPDYAVSPGDHIQEWIDDHNINAAELARRLNVTPKHVSELLSGKAPLSASVSLGLERVTGIPARIWNGFEATYREDLARLAEEGILEAQHEEAKKFPLAYLRKFNMITASAHDKSGTVRQLLTLLGISHLDAFDATWVHAKVSYRKTTVSSDKDHKRATWLALGEREFQKVDLPEFDKERLESVLPKIRALTASPDIPVALETTKKLLADAGVALFLIPPIPGFGVYGATRWIDGRPVIQLSTLGRTDDQLWFTLFHEIGHVLLHDQKSLFLEGQAEGSSAVEEKEADDFAAQYLIPEG